MAQLGVSVVIPTYNRAALLPRAIASAVANVAAGDEIIIVDDGSTDHTAAVVRGYGERLRYLPLPHAGAGAARNAGIEAAANPLIAFLDSDDEWLPGKLALQRAVFRRWPEVRLCFTDFQVRDREGVLHHRYLRRWHRDSRDWAKALGPAQAEGGARVHVGNVYRLLMARLYVATFTAVVRVDSDSPLPRFPVDLPTYEDWQFFGHAAAYGPSAFVDCETAIQHGHRLPRLTDAGTRVEAETRVRVLRRVWGADAPFLERHGPEYERLLAEHRDRVQVAVAREYLKSGDTIAARVVLNHAGQAPPLLRWCARLPGNLAASLIVLRDWILP